MIVKRDKIMSKKSILVEIYNSYKEKNNLTFLAEDEENRIQLRSSYIKIINSIPQNLTDTFINLILSIRKEEQEKFEIEKETILEFGIKLGLNSQQ